MLVFDFGFTHIIILPILHSVVMCFIVLCISLCAVFVLLYHYKIVPQVIIRKYLVVWYCLVLFIFSSVAIGHQDKFNIEKLNIETIISCALILLIMLPFFRKFSLFGNEFESSFNREKELAKEMIERSEELSAEEEKKLQPNERISTEVKNDRAKFIRQLKNIRKHY